MDINQLPGSLGVAIITENYQKLTRKNPNPKSNPP